MQKNEKTQFKKGEVALFVMAEQTYLCVIEQVKENGCDVVFNNTNLIIFVESEHLIKIANNNAYTIIRHSNSNNIENSPSRKLASQILGQVELYGDFYYKLEDWLTNFLEGRKHDLPRGTEGEYLRSALRIEVRDYFDCNENIEDIESEDIEEVVDRIVNSSCNILNMDLIEEAVEEYIKNKNSSKLLGGN